MHHENSDTDTDTDVESFSFSVLVPSSILDWLPVLILSSTRPYVLPAHTGRTTPQHKSLTAMNTHQKRMVLSSSMSKGIISIGIGILRFSAHICRARFTSGDRGPGYL